MVWQPWLLYNPHVFPLYIWTGCSLWLLPHLHTVASLAWQFYGLIIPTFWHSSDIAKPDLLTDFLQVCPTTKTFAPRKNNLCLRADSCCCSRSAVPDERCRLSATVVSSSFSPNRIPQRHLYLRQTEKLQCLSTIHIITFANRPLPCRLELVPSSRDILSPLTFSSHRAEPYINLVPGTTLQPLKQPRKLNCHFFVALC